MHPAAEAKKAELAIWVALWILIPPDPTEMVACSQVEGLSKLMFKTFARIECSFWSNNPVLVKSSMGQF